MVEEIDLEKCNFGTSEAQWPWSWPWIQSKSYWCAYLVEVYQQTKLDRNRKNYMLTDGQDICTYGWMDGETWVLIMAALRSRCGHYILVLFMAALCNRAGHFISLSCGFFFLSSSFSPHLISAIADWMSTILEHMVWRGLNANLECRSEMCCMRLAGNARTKRSPKIRHLRTIAQLCRAISLQQRHVLTIEKKLLKQQYLPHMSLQYTELQLTSGWDPFVSLGHPS